MKNKGMFLFSFMPVVVLTSFLRTAPIKIASVATGSLVKGSLSIVYYLGADNKRYVFPNDKVYFSWYSDFSTVQTISDADLAAYPLAGNVTYRPGTRLVKIQSDPKVYAVEKGGVLRWLNSESAAVAIFGANWNQRVDDIADAFFVNYSVGSPISMLSDYNPTSELSADPNINVDKGLASAPANTTNNSAAANGSVSVSLSPYNSTLAANQSTTVTATGYDPDGIVTMSIYVNGSPSQSCPITGSTTSGTCTLTLYGSNYANGAAISVYAQETDIYGNISTSTTASLTAQNAANTTTNGSVSISLSPYTYALTANESTTVTATGYDPDGLASMGIYVNGSLTQSCSVGNSATSGTCALTLYGSNYVNGASVSVYAQETDIFGNIATSTTASLTMQNAVNTAANGSVSVSLSPYNSTLAANQSTTVTATGYDPDGLASMGIYVNGSLTQSCSVGNSATSGTCALTLYGNNYSSGASISVYAQETDIHGNIATSSTSTLTAQGTSGASGNNGPVSITLSPYASALPAGASTTATANAYNPVGIAELDIYVNSAIAKSCSIANSPANAACSFTIYGSNYSIGSTVSVYAVETDHNGSTAVSPTANLTLTAQNAANTTNNGSVSVALSPYASTLASNQSTTVTATGYDSDGLTSMSIYVNGSLLQSCSVVGNATSGNCTVAISGSSYSSYSTISVYAQATDVFGNVSSSSTSTLSIQNGANTSGNAAVSLSFTPYTSTISTSQATTAIANATSANGLTTMQIYVNGSLVQSCAVSNYPTSGSCAFALNGGNYANGSTVSVYAQAIDRYGTVTTSSTSYITI
jgi:hypothetical protein